MIEAASVRASAILRRLPRGGEIRGAEIGVYDGRLSRRLLERVGLSLIMVDAWEANGTSYVDGSNDFHAELSEAQQLEFMRQAAFTTNFAWDRRRIIRSRSSDAALTVADESLDFAFIDADHSEQGVARDLDAWWRKVKPGGLLCGHDYGHADFPGVALAVKAFSERTGQSVELGDDNTWFIKKVGMLNLIDQCRPAVTPEQMVENMRSSLSRGLREVRTMRPHGEGLAVAAGGPSLKDTYRTLAGQGHVGAVNGSLGFLLDNGIVPEFCAVVDSGSHMADIVAADKRVRYLVASNCDPSLFDKLIASGCKVWLWHTTPSSIGTDEGLELLKSKSPDNWQMIGGGCTVGLRWVSLGYVLGYREFHLHGLDSSFRDTTHAYDDRRSVEDYSLEVCGFRTSLNFLQQVTDAAHMIERFSQSDMEPTTFHIYGDGLLQTLWRNWEANKSTMSATEAFQKWA